MFWKTLGRMILVPIAFLLSAILSVFVLATLSLERITQEVYRTGDEAEKISAIVTFALDSFTLAAGASIIPAIAAVIIGEVARIRSAIYYIVAGGLALAAIPLMANFTATAEQGMTNIILWQVFAAAGFAGGLLYWLLAGRTA